jgi:hypothetical protein
MEITKGKLVNGSFVLLADSFNIFIIIVEKDPSTSRLNR